MKYCGRCGNSMQDDMIFCSKCGTQQEQATAPSPQPSPPPSPQPTPQPSPQPTNPQDKFQAFANSNPMLVSIGSAAGGLIIGWSFSMLLGFLVAVVGTVVCFKSNNTVAKIFPPIAAVITFIWLIMYS